MKPLKEKFKYKGNKYKIKYKEIKKPYGVLFECYCKVNKKTYASVTTELSN